MFSPFSSLFTYVVVGLAISAAATPMGLSHEGHDNDDGSKSPSYPDSSSYSSYPSPTPSKYPGDDTRPKPYAAEAYLEDKKNPEEKYPKEKQPEEKYPKEKQPEEKYPKEKPYPKADDKEKPHSDRPQGQYPPQKSPDGKPDDKDNSYAGSPKYNDQCNVGKQECCNGYNESKDERHANFLNSLDSYFGMGDITQKIKNSDKFWATNCSPSGTGSQCTAKPMCCEENHWDGLIVIGCTNINVEFPINAGGGR